MEPREDSKRSKKSEEEDSDTMGCQPPPSPEEDKLGSCSQVVAMELLPESKQWVGICNRSAIGAATSRVWNL